LTFKDQKKRISLETTAQPQFRLFEEGVIVGARLGIVDPRNNNAQVFNFSLNKSDCDDIHTICTKSNNLFGAIGDCSDEYR
jgi:hypothetical protein